MKLVSRNPIADLERRLHDACRCALDADVGLPPLCSAVEATYVHIATDEKGLTNEEIAARTLCSARTVKRKRKLDVWEELTSEETAYRNFRKAVLKLCRLKGKTRAELSAALDRNSPCGRYAENLFLFERELNRLLDDGFLREDEKGRLWACDKVLPVKRTAEAAVLERLRLWNAALNRPKQWTTWARRAVLPQGVTPRDYLHTVLETAIDSVVERELANKAVEKEFTPYRLELMTAPTVHEPRCEADPLSLMSMMLDAHELSKLPKPFRAIQTWRVDFASKNSAKRILNQEMVPALDVCLPTSAAEDSRGPTSLAFVAFPITDAFSH